MKKSIRDMIAAAARDVDAVEHPPIDPVADAESDAQAEAEAAETLTHLGEATFFALQGQRHIYGGTVPPEVVAKRRAKNRHARRQRRGNQAAIRRAARLAESRNRTYRRLGRFVTGSLDHLGLIEDAEVVES